MPPKAATRPRRPSPKSVSSPEKRAEVDVDKLPLGIVLYGPSGVGKTSLAANFPKPGFVYDPQEEGILALRKYKQVPDPVFVQQTDSFEHTLSICADIASGSYDVQTAVFDSLTGLEKLIFHYHCSEYFDGDWSKSGFYNFQQGPKNAAKTDVPRLLDALDSVRRAGIDVVLIAHSTIKSYSNPTGPDYDRFIPVCDKETWQQVHRWAKGVFFYNYYVDVEVRKTKGPASFNKGKAQSGSDQRYIYTEWDAAYDAKNQMGLPPLIDAGHSGAEAYKALAEALGR